MGVCSSNSAAKLKAALAVEQKNTESLEKAIEGTALLVKIQLPFF